MQPKAERGQPFNRLAARLLVAPWLHIVFPPGLRVVTGERSVLVRRDSRLGYEPVRAIRPSLPGRDSAPARRTIKGEAYRSLVSRNAGDWAAVSVALIPEGRRPGRLPHPPGWSALRRSVISVGGKRNKIKMDRSFRCNLDNADARSDKPADFLRKAPREWVRSHGRVEAIGTSTDAWVQCRNKTPESNPRRGRAADR